MPYRNNDIQSLIESYETKIEELKKKLKKERETNRIWEWIREQDDVLTAIGIILFIVTIFSVPLTIDLLISQTTEDCQNQLEENNIDCIPNSTTTDRFDDICGCILTTGKTVTMQWDDTR